jgi:Zn-dependent protease
MLIFLVGFGWGKPSPFNPTYFRRYKRDTALVAIAGPVSNILFLLAAAILLKISATFGLPSLWNKFLEIAVETNLILAVFNLIPIPPLDGSKLIYAALPDEYDDAFHRFESIGPLLILGLFLFGSALISPVYTQLLDFIVRVFGL